MAEYKVVGGSKIHKTAIVTRPTQIRIGTKSEIHEHVALNPEIPKFDISSAPGVDESSGSAGTITIGSGVSIGKHTSIRPPSAQSAILLCDAATTSPSSAPTQSAAALPLPHLISSGKVSSAVYHGVVIGDGAKIGDRVTSRASHIGFGVIVGDDCVLRDGCVLLNGAVIAAGSTVAAGSVVGPMAAIGAVESSPFRLTHSFGTDLNDITHVVPSVLVPASLDAST